MTGYHLSRFAVALPVQDRKDELIAVYSTLTEALILIPGSKWMNILNSAPTVDAETVGQLIQQGILIRGDVDETVVFKEWRQRHIHDFNTMRSKILVTRRCNNRCIYCILDPEAKDMTAETAYEIDNFYLEQIKRNHPQQVRDDYLGGEPLMNLDMIIESASRRFYFCKGRGIDYGFTITTNGTLVTRTVISKLKAVGLTAVRVSLAGPAEVHDRLRPYVGGGKTYETIMKNLEKISGSIPIRIECQYDAGARDFEQIPEMLNDMNRRNIRVEDIAFTPILEKRGNGEFCAGMGEVDNFLFLKQEAARRGLSVNGSVPSNLCMADFRSIYVFDTDGSIIPCPSLQGGEMAYGNVLTGIDFVAESQLLNRKLPDQCLKQCELLPLCMGGCRLQALTRQNDFNGIDCHYDIYRSLLEDYIRAQVFAALSQDGFRSNGQAS
ncbi:MAG: radical SAM protein [Deltaproteobacteria bacterium]|nr:radical SAM protein [Deltaproteobacteria bacterium]MBW2247849.1 radical SAM protein [Deltaproteobacteria bacterium]MBW2640426.1 radical SAM protein [Deltaproteobacteria bacterium]